MSTFFHDWYYLSIRSIKQIWRPLLALIPSLFIPIFFFVVNAASLSAFADVPGFPECVSYRDFIAPIALFRAVFALRTQNARLVQSLFVIVFPFLYLTTSQAPMHLLPPLFRTLATYNPVTYIIEGVRALVLSGWGDPAIWKGYLVAIVMFVVLVTVALASFKKVVK